MADIRPILTHLPVDKMAAISQTTYSNEFTWIESLYFDYIFIEVCP